MPKTVYDAVEVELQDGKVVTLRPMAIRSMRNFMKAWEKFEEVEKGEEDQLSVFIECCGIALDKELKDKVDVRFDSDTKKMTEEYEEYLEDVLDMETIYKVIEVCAGLKLNDPNLIAAAQRAAAEAGTN